MTPLSPPFGDGGLTFWRIDQQKHAGTWSSGEGAFLAGGRWNVRGTRCVYAAHDPATAILEVAVHKGFDTLDIRPHVVTRGRIAGTVGVRIVEPQQIPNSNWLHPGLPSLGQQRFGDALLDQHAVVLVPSVVSRNSWNIIFRPGSVETQCAEINQERLGLDPRLNPPT
ncbi:MAG: RES domain-containing protein [Pseudomonadota bacterium]